MPLDDYSAAGRELGLGDMLADERDDELKKREAERKFLNVMQPDQLSPAGQALAALQRNRILFGSTR